MPDRTYIVRFTYTDGTVEVCEHTTYAEAKDQFGVFDESDADIYSGIALIERNWTDGNDYLIEVKAL